MADTYTGNSDTAFYPDQRKGNVASGPITAAAGPVSYDGSTVSAPTPASPSSGSFGSAVLDAASANSPAVAGARAAYPIVAGAVPDLGNDAASQKSYYEGDGSSNGSGPPPIRGLAAGSNPAPSVKVSQPSDRSVEATGSADADKFASFGAPSGPIQQAVENGGFANSDGGNPNYTPVQRAADQAKLDVYAARDRQATEDNAAANTRTVNAARAQTDQYTANRNAQVADFLAKNSADVVGGSPYARALAQKRYGAVAASADAASNAANAAVRAATAPVAPPNELQRTAEGQGIVNAATAGAVGAQQGQLATQSAQVQLQQQQRLNALGEQLQTETDPAKRGDIIQGILALHGVAKDSSNYEVKEIQGPTTLSDAGIPLPGAKDIAVIDRRTGLRVPGPGAQADTAPKPKYTEGQQLKDPKSGKLYKIVNGVLVEQ